MKKVFLPRLTPKVVGKSLIDCGDFDPRFKQTPPPLWQQIIYRHVVGEDAQKERERETETSQGSIF